MAHPKGKTSAEVSGVPGWCYRCKLREKGWCKQYEKTCVSARSDDDCVKRPKVDRNGSCNGRELGSIRGLHRFDIEEMSISWMYGKSKSGSK